MQNTNFSHKICFDKCQMGIHAYTHAQWSTNRGCFLEIIVLEVSRCIFFEGGAVGSGNTCGTCKTITINAARISGH